MASTISKLNISPESVLATATLPALPQSAMGVLEVCRSEDFDPRDLAEPIEADSALSAQVLRFVNSAYFGFQQKINSIRQGICLVGVRAIQHFVMRTALFCAVADPKTGLFSLDSFRKDSLRRGVFAKLVAALLHAQDVDEVFTAAMLQDIAVPLLTREVGDPYQKLLDQRAGGQRRLSDIELEALGWTHADAGALLLSRWQLPDSLAELVRVHAREESLVPGSASDAAIAVSMSALLPSAVDSGWSELEQLQGVWDQLPKGPSIPLSEFLCTVDWTFENFTMDQVNEAYPLVRRYNDELGAQATSPS